MREFLRYLRAAVVIGALAALTGLPVAYAALVAVMLVAVAAINRIQ